MPFWEVFKSAREVLEARIGQLENNSPTPTGEKWEAYEKLKPVIRTGKNLYYREEMANEELSNVHIAHQVLAPLVQRCILNARHTKALATIKEDCLAERTANTNARPVPPCLSCDRIEVANVTGEVIKGLFLGKR